MGKLNTLLLALKTIIKYNKNALNWENFPFTETRIAYERGEIEKNEISIDDFFSQYNIKNLLNDVKIVLKQESFSLSDLETEIVCAIALGTHAKKIFEIGTFLGRTTVNLAYNTRRDAQIYTLNLPQRDCSFVIGKHIREHEEKAEKITQLFGDSQRFDFSAYYNEIDLMLVDGDHSYKAVLSDGEKAIECVKSGGFIVWHDFEYRFLGVSKAIIQVCRKHQLDLRKIDVTRLGIAQKK